MTPNPSVGALLGATPDVRLTVRVGRYEIDVSNHAAYRWRTRAGGTCDAELAAAVEGSRPERVPPPWARLSLWHRARLAFALPASGGAFIVTRNGDGRHVAATFLIPTKETP